MLEEYFSAPKTLRRLRTGPSAPYIDGFAAMLQENGYSVASAVRYLRAAVHLGHFLDSRGYRRAFVAIYRIAAARSRTAESSITTSYSA
jgi:hypothetical protein